MPQYKFTAQRGKTDLKDIAVSVGTAEAQSDTVSINLDVTNITRGEAVQLLEPMINQILRGPWPPL